MFGDSSDEWGGKESIDGDIPVEDAMSIEEEEETFITVPRTKSTAVPRTQREESESPPRDVSASPAPERLNPKQKALKDIFQAQEDSAGFSLLANLGDLDLELENDPAFNFSAPAPEPGIIPESTYVQQPTIQAAGITLDPTLPLFFPQPDSMRAKDVFSVGQAERWSFGRSGDSDSIRKRWEETKGDLTKEWKKRSREAVKARKRRYGAAEGEDA
ncbi:hypothetical protein M422DRAFT_271403 [Sphaerobolus stellatus SS14]|uniref:Uncharacterized protein n=1 Tax=Sphaerobolus stellatus (strain SS14) TaxID=990650 RepID=A0A0C9U0D4_SPHS4|nr:hypothetical protein M422DRAFT_271403 [Sphaerobolus stellatus SS14]